MFKPKKPSVRRVHCRDIFWNNTDSRYYQVNVIYRVGGTQQVWHNKTSKLVLNANNYILMAFLFKKCVFLCTRFCKVSQALLTMIAIPRNSFSSKMHFILSPCVFCSRESSNIYQIKTKKYIPKAKWDCRLNNSPAVHAADLSLGHSLLVFAKRKR